MAGSVMCESIEFEMSGANVSIKAPLVVWGNILMFSRSIAQILVKKSNVSFAMSECIHREEAVPHIGKSMWKAQASRSQTNSGSIKMGGADTPPGVVWRDAGSCAAGGVIASTNTLSMYHIHPTAAETLRRLH